LRVDDSGPTRPVVAHRRRLQPAATRCGPKPESGSGWNAQPGRSRRQPAAELRHSRRSSCLARARRSV